MKRKRYSAGEVRFRISKADHDRIEWLLEHHPDGAALSNLLRILILREYERLQPKTVTH